MVKEDIRGKGRMKGKVSGESVDGRKRDFDKGNREGYKDRQRRLERCYRGKQNCGKYRWEDVESYKT